ncbi:hypothetical protein ACWCYZ_41745 [Streptomyces virginiae]
MTTTPKSGDELFIDVGRELECIDQSTSKVANLSINAYPAKDGLTKGLDHPTLELDVTGTSVKELDVTGY